MTEDGGQGGNDKPVPIDTSKAHPARVYDFLLGGHANYPADREAAEAIMAISPSVVPSVRANRAFLRRAVQYLAGEAGIRQFLDIGTGLPTEDNVHEIAQEVAPDSRIVYVDNDPIVLAQSRALLTSAREGATAYVHADIRDVYTIFREASHTLDMREPTAVMLVSTMQYVPDSAHPHDLVARLMRAVMHGSYLTMSDTTRDIRTEEMMTGAAEYNERLGPAQFTPRTREEFANFFDGLEFVEPGLVPLPQWRAEANPDQVIPMYAAMARKP